VGIDAAALLLDATLAATVVALGWRCVITADRFETVAVFIGISLVMAIAWTRLEAPDLALAEAALGAGLNGALLLAAWAETRGIEDGPAERRIAGPALLAATTMAVVGAGLAPLVGAEAGLAAEIAARLDQTGVSYPVTAVLVDFRALDTLLELCVLLAALAATWQLGAARPLLRGKLYGPVFVAYVRIALPLLVVLAAALLWRGATSPGGAFQAGATLAAAGVLLLLVNPAGRVPALSWAYRICASLGVLAFLGLGTCVTAVTGRFLDWPLSHAGALVLVAETAATVAIATTLALLVVGGRPVAQRVRVGKRH
jgi:multisubunit Na+/H+ antiporter MnhB subunit